MVALCSAAGFASEYLAARWPHERKSLEAAALEARELRETERKELARLIRKEMTDLLDRSMP